MGKQRHTAEQIISKLREAEVLQGKGMALEEVLCQLGISDVTYYKWRKEYGGLRPGSGEAAEGAGTREQSTAEGGIGPLD